MSEFNEEDLFVKKRSGKLEPVSFDKILVRVKKIGEESGLKSVKYSALVMKIIDQLYNGIETSKIDELTCEQCASMTTVSSDYAILASQIAVSNHEKNTPYTLAKTVDLLWNFYDIHGHHSPIISEDYYKIVIQNRSRIVFIF